MATTANFSPATGLLSVFGDKHKNTITVSRNAAGKLLINDGTIDIIGGIPTVANTTVIDVFGQGGNDIISLDETNGIAACRSAVRRCRQRLRSLVAPATISCSARTATMPFSARVAMTCCSVARATMC